MSDIRTQKLGHLIVNYSLEVKPNDKVLIRGSQAVYPMLLEAYRAVIRAGGQPLVMWQDAGFTEILLKEGIDEQVSYVPEVMKDILQSYDCLITIGGEANTRTLTGADPARQRAMQLASSELGGIVMQRAAKGELRWIITMYPTQAYAQEADMSLAEYEDFVYGACHLDKADPVAEWRKVHETQEKLVQWLKGKKQVKVKGEHVDLSLSINGRSFVNSDGKHNMPCGEIFTGPVENSVNGWVRYTYPAVYTGREVEGVELKFEAGKVVSAKAKKNETFLQEILETDEGAKYLGEFAIGTNFGIQRFTKSILFDEKIGGTFHMALGRGYPETGSKNLSGVHWDMICDMRHGGQIWVDDELFYESGNFLI